MAKDNITVKTSKRKIITKEPETVASQKVSNSDLYNKVIAFEEEESKARNADEDAKLYMDTCSDIKLLLENIARAKLSSPKKNCPDIKEIHTQITVKILLLKKLNRLQKVRTNECRLSLQKYRDQVDNDHLHLQNLVYEQLHLSKEVTRCYEFKSIDEEMDLIPVDEFYATAPESVSKPSVSKENPHEQKLARLTWELMQRKEISKKIKALESAKEAIRKEIEVEKEQLNNLGPQLKTLLEATLPLQDVLNMPIEKTRRLHETAMLLPKPLYVLFVQADAYSSLVKWLNVTITGKADDVKAEDHHLDEISSDSDSENEAEQQSRRRKSQIHDRRKSSGSGVDAAEARQEECLRRHPLTVVLTIALSKDMSTALQFQWLTVLETVSVVAVVTTANGSGIAASDLLSPSLFSALFPGDTGEICPNPATFYHMKRAGLENFPTNVNGLGLPYQWAQTLCGLKNLTESPDVDVATCQRCLETTLHAVRQRLRNRTCLAKELKQLETGEAIKDKKVEANILSLTKITASDLYRVPAANRLLELAVIDSTFLFYRVSIELFDVKVTAYVAVPPNYPSVSPIITLEIVHQKKCLTSLNNDHVREIEREINVLHESSEGGEVLLGQMHKLMLCCKVLAVTELGLERRVSATSFRAIQGRLRSHPYRYMPIAGGIFTHR